MSVPTSLPTSLLIWGGPVMAMNIAKVRWMSPVTPLVVNHGPDGGIGSSSFSMLADSYRDAQGRILPNLLAKYGLKRSMFDRVAIAGFSAFHGLASPLLLADGDSIDAAVLDDACFSNYASLAKKGYVSFGARAARGERLMVMTTSAGGGPSVGYSTGYECGDASFAGAVAESGVSPEPYSPPVPVPVPISGKGQRAGDFFYLNYNTDYAHGDHVHKLAVPVLDVFLAPYLARPLGAPGPLHYPPVSPGFSGAQILAGVGVAALIGGLTWATRKRAWPS